MRNPATVEGLHHSRNTQAENDHPVKPIVISPASVIKLITRVALFFIVAHIYVMVNEIYLRHDNLLTRIVHKYFDIDNDASIPTLFSFLLLFFSSLLLFFIFLSKRAERKSYRIHWLVLSFIFLFLAFDEALMFHEVYGSRIGELILRYFNFGELWYMWVIPYTLFGIACLIFFIPFLLELPKKIRAWIVIGGFIYVTGAVGMEISPGIASADKNVDYDLFWRVWQLIEETLEMTGIIMFIYALLTYITDNHFKLILKSHKQE